MNDVCPKVREVVLRLLQTAQLGQNLGKLGHFLQYFCPFRFLSFFAESFLFALSALCKVLKDKEKWRMPISREIGLHGCRDWI